MAEHRSDEGSALFKIRHAHASSCEPSRHAKGKDWTRDIRLLGVHLRPLPADLDRPVKRIPIVSDKTFPVNQRFSPLLTLFHPSCSARRRRLRADHRVRRGKQCLNAEQDCPDLQRRRPLVFENVQAYPAKLVCEHVNSQYFRCGSQRCTCSSHQCWGDTAAWEKKSLSA